MACILITICSVIYVSGSVFWLCPPCLSLNVLENAMLMWLYKLKKCFVFFTINTDTFERVRVEISSAA